jgi:fructoselysine-6-P-deglycase FrlB-like protein
MMADEQKQQMEDIQKSLEEEKEALKKLKQQYDSKLVHALFTGLALSLSLSLSLSHTHTHTPIV